jgi:hypothetical protein
LSFPKTASKVLVKTIDFAGMYHRCTTGVFPAVENAASEIAILMYRTHTTYIPSVLVLHAYKGVPKAVAETRTTQNTYTTQILICTCM